MAVCVDHLAKTYSKIIEDLLNNHGNRLDGVACLAQALRTLHCEGKGLTGLWESTELQYTLVQLHGRIVRAAISLSSNPAPTSASTSTSSPAPAPLPSSCTETANPLLHTYRQILTAAQLCLQQTQEATISRRHSVALALLRSDSLHCFSRLIALDARQLQLAMDALRREEALLSTTRQYQEQQQDGPAPTTPFPQAPASPSGAGAHHCGRSAAPSEALLPDSQQHALAASRQQVQQRRLCLYHSAEEAASLLLWMLNSVNSTTGISNNCGCQLCAGQRDEGKDTDADRGQAGRVGNTTGAGGSGEGGDGISRGNDASEGSGSAGGRSSSSSSSLCLLLAVWRALHESGLVEQLVAGVLLLFGRQQDGEGTGGGGSRSKSNAGGAGGGTDGGSPFHLGGLTHVGQGEPAGSRGPAGAFGPSRITQAQMAAEELRVYADWSRLQREACREYHMHPAQEALRAALRSLPGGMLLPHPDHPSWPHVRGCLSRPGCQLAAAAAMVAAVCAEDGGPTYGMELGPLLAAAGAVPLAATEEALAEAAGDVERPATLDLRSNRIVRLRNALNAWRTRRPPPAEADMRGLGFTSRLCKRVLALCLGHAGLAGDEAGVEGAHQGQSEAGDARLEGTAAAVAARAGGFRWLGGTAEVEVARLAVQALETLAWASQRRGATGGRGAVRTAAAAAAVGQQQGRNEEEEDLGARAVEGGLWLPVWWWRKALQVLPLLMARRAPATGWVPELAAHEELLHTRRALPRNCVFPAAAPPDVSHPLRAGLLPTLERLLTPDRTACLAARDGVSGLQVAGALGRTLLGCRPDWGWLLAYADPQEAASLMRTCAQLLRHHVEQLEDQSSCCEVWMDSLRQLVGSLSQVLLAACAPSMQAVGAYAAAAALGATSARAKCGPWAVLCTTTRCPHCSPGSPWRGDPGSGSSGGSSSGRAGSSGGDGGCSSSKSAGDSGGAAAAASFCPGRRLATNVSSALLHLLPALTHAVYRVAERGRRQWAADAAGCFLAALVPLCARVQVDADVARELGKQKLHKHKRQHMGQRCQPSVSSGRPTPESEGAWVGGGASGAQDWSRPGAGAGPTSSLDAAPAYASAPGPRSWRGVLLGLDPIRLLKLQLRSAREPYVFETGSILGGVAAGMPEELGEAVRGDSELCALLAIRGLKASPAARREYLHLALVLEPCKALYGCRMCCTAGWGWRHRPGLLGACAVPRSRAVRWRRCW